MKLRMINDPVLRDPTSLVLEEDLMLVNSFLSEMIQIMKDKDGQGLAANQVGISKRFFILKDGEGVELVINPEILEIGDLSPFDEGCLSIPGTSAQTQRAQRIKIKYKDSNFLEVEREFNGMSAVAVQHEIDHLDGKLYIDQLEPVRKDLVLRKHKKFMRRK